MIKIEQIYKSIKYSPIRTDNDINTILHNTVLTKINDTPLSSDGNLHYLREIDSYVFDKGYTPLFNVINLYYDLIRASFHNIDFRGGHYLTNNYVNLISTNDDLNSGNRGKDVNLLNLNPCLNSMISRLIIQRYPYIKKNKDIIYYIMLSNLYNSIINYDFENYKSNIRTVNTGRTSRCQHELRTRRTNTDFRWLREESITKLKSLFLHKLSLFNSNSNLDSTFVIENSKICDFMLSMMFDDYNFNVDDIILLSNNKDTDIIFNCPSIPLDNTKYGRLFDESDYRVRKLSDMVVLKATLRDLAKREDMVSLVRNSITLIDDVL